MTPFVPPAPPPRPGGRLAALVRYAADLRRASFDPTTDATVRASLLVAVLTDVQRRRGPAALWRHAARIQRALDRAIGAERSPARAPTLREARAALADGAPVAFAPDRRTVRLLLALAARGEAVIVGPVRGTVQAVRAGAPWSWSFEAQTWVPEPAPGRRRRAADGAPSRSRPRPPLAPSPGPRSRTIPRPLDKAAPGDLRDGGALTSGEGRERRSEKGETDPRRP